MRVLDPEAPRAETIIATLIYLLTHYARNGCPRLAVCVFRHMECVASHPGAARVIRQVCASLQGDWAERTRRRPSTLEPRAALDYCASAGSTR